MRKDEDSRPRRHRYDPDGEEPNDEAPPPVNRDGYIEFKTGATRQCIKPRFDLIPRDCLVRLATVYLEGMRKYGVDNWKKGMPWSDTLNHAIDHLLAWKEGRRDEDHLGHAAWGIFTLMFFEMNDYREDCDLPLLTETLGVKPDEQTAGKAPEGTSSQAPGT